MDVFGSIAAALAGPHPELEPSDFAFAPPPTLELGDVAVRFFEAARKLEMPPPKLAAELAERAAFGPEVVEAHPAGPYLNLKLDRAVFARGIVEAVLAQGARFGSNHSGAGKHVLIEHTSINPNASPHVGRGRCAMIGDSVVRLLRFEDYDVEVHYYVNDMGRQIGLLVLVCDDIETLDFDAVLERYVAANQRAEAEPAFAEQGYDLLAKMEQGDPETRERFRAVTDLCLEGQLAVLARLGASYDVFDRESKYVNDPRLEAVQAKLRERDALFVDEEQRLVVDLSKIGHKREEGRYFVLMRANGSSMYGYRDIAYAIDKHERGAGHDMMVLGEDHKLYAEQLALILEAAGYPAPECIYYSYILLKGGAKMATRKGEVVLLSDFLDEAQRLSAERVAEQCTDLAPEEQQAIAAQVAVAAIRFAVLRVNPNKNVLFDWDASLSFTGDTGPYVQYSCARISSILRKFGALPEACPEAFPADTDAEWALLTKLAAFPEVVAGAVKQRNCAPVAQFALDVARLFTGFYHDCPVLKAESEAHQAARALICAATRRTLENALGLLGIEAPERM